MTSFCKKINKTGNALTTLTKKKKKERDNSKAKMRNGRDNNTTDNYRNTQCDNRVL